MKKGQLSYPIITFMFVIVALIIMAPIMMRVINDTTSKFGNALVTSGIGGGVEANQSIMAVTDTFNNFWDFLIIIAFLVNVILLFLSAFLVDIHPVFFILYFVFAFISIMFVPTITNLGETIYTSPEYTNYTATSSLHFTTTLLNHFGIVMLAIIVLTAIIMYGKLRTQRAYG